MSTEMIVYDKIADPFAAITIFGEDIAKSGLFGCTNVSQGRVLAMECFARRTTALSLGERYHIMMGKLSMRADAMLAAFHDIGGKHVISEYSPNACEVKFTIDGEAITIRITWEQAQKEKWPYAKDGKTLKDNWATEIGRQDMMWARVVSRGVKRLRPKIVCGYYTPDEIEDFADDAPVANTKSNGTPRKSVDQIVAEQAAATTAVQSTQSSPSSQVEDADFEPAEPVAASKTALMDSIRSLWVKLGADAEDQIAMVRKERCGRPGAGALIGLDDEQLRDLEGKLKAAVSELSAEEATELNPQASNPIAAADDPPFDVDGDAIDAGPVSEVQLANITKLLEVLGETNPMVYDNVATQLEQLGEGTKLRMLTAHQANVLINDLKKGDTVLTGMRLFIAESLNQAKLAAAQEKAGDKTPHYATEAGNQ